MEIINEYTSRVEELRNKGYRVKIEEYLRKGLWIFKQRPELFLLFAALNIFLMPIGGFLLAGPISAGFFIVAYRIDKGKFVQVDHLFDGFKMFVPLFLVTIISAVMVFLGSLAFIIPGIYLSIAYTFALFFILFGNSEVWEAMELSRKLVHREWFSVFMLVLALGVVNILGALAFGVGLLFTIPVSYCALYAAFDDIVGVN